MKRTVQVDNLKCGGCAAAIRKDLLNIPGVEEVNVDPGQGSVEVELSDGRAFEHVKLELKKLGYPETGTVKGLRKLTTGMQAYISCAIGKISSNDRDDKDHAA